MSKSTVFTSPSCPCKTVNNSKASSSTNSHSHTLLSREHVASSDADAFHAQPARDAVGAAAIRRHRCDIEQTSRRWRGGGREDVIDANLRLRKVEKQTLSHGPLTSLSCPSSVAKISHASSWRDRRQTQHVASKDVAANNVPQGAQATLRTVLS